MECKYRFIKEDITSFVPQYSDICARCASKPPFPACNEERCAYIKEKREEEFRKNPPPKPGFRYCPFVNINSRVECSIYLNNCGACGLNPAVKERREKELAEQERLKEESRLSNKI